MPQKNKAQNKALRNKNLALLGVLLALIVLIYFISLMRMKAGA